MSLISDRRIAILAEHGVNQRELSGPRERLEKAGVKVEIVSPHMPELKAWADDNWGIRIKVDRQVNDALSDHYDGVLIPGGPLHTDELRMNPLVIDFIRQMFSAGKPVAAISHGIQVLINAESIQGRQVTSSGSLRTDATLAGANWVDQDVVSDNGLVTCRCEDDLEAFNKAFLETLRQGLKQRSETII